MNKIPRRRKGERAGRPRKLGVEEDAARTVRSLSRISAALAAVAVGAVAFSVVFVGNAQGKLSLLDSETVPVLVASAPIEAGTTVEEGMVETKDVPSYAVTEGSLSDPSDAVGRKAVGPIPQNGQVSESSLSASQAALSLADALEPDKVAISLAVDAETGLSGLVKQGDVVDVLAQGGTAVEGAKVLAVDASLDQAQTEYSTVTLQCGKDQAAILHDAQANAPTRLVLRPSSPVGAADPTGGE